MSVYLDKLKLAETIKDAIKLDASQIVSGVLDIERIPDLTRSKITDFWSSPFWGNIPDKPSTFPPSAHASTHAKGGADEVSLDASQITSGVFDPGLIPWTEIPASGIVIGGDAKLYRPGANTLKTDSKLVVGGDSWFDKDSDQADRWAFASRVAGESPARFTIRADGKMEWGAGGVERDVNLYRAEANILKTDDSFYVGGHFEVEGGSKDGFKQVAESGWVGLYFQSVDDGGTTRKVRIEMNPNARLFGVKDDVNGWFPFEIFLDGSAKFRKPVAIADHKYSPISIVAPHQKIPADSVAWGIRLGLPANRTLKLWKVFGDTTTTGYVYAQVYNVTDDVMLDERDLGNTPLYEGAPLGSWSYTSKKTILFRVKNKDTVYERWGGAVWVITIE